MPGGIANGKFWICHTNLSNDVSLTSVCTWHNNVAINFWLATPIASRVCKCFARIADDSDTVVSSFYSAGGGVCFDTCTRGMDGGDDDWELLEKHKKIKLFSPDGLQVACR